jgi:DNA-binding transcriptional regulator YdaS (Cro superfamily)
MNLQDYFAEEPRGAKKEMAEYLGITQTWMGLLINGHRYPSLDLVKKIVRATQGLVTRHDLRPDIFGPDQEIL